ncbi:MAG: guanylate cyclase, partial [Chloroflexota bacterium]
VAAEDDLLTQFLWRSVRGKLLARAGRIDEGALIAREAVRLAHTSDDPVAQGNAVLALAEVHALGGHDADAAASLDAAIARFDAKGSVASIVEARRRMDQVSAWRGSSQPRGIGRIG